MDLTAREKAFLEKITPIARENNTIDPALYSRYNVKRGLRNEDGSGVLVGLTEIGEVHGYVIDEGEVVPVPGRLLYRGISVEDLVAGFQADGRFGFEETVFLLLFGYLPTKSELEEFQAVLGENRNLPGDFTESTILKNPSSDIMNKLARSVLTLYSFDPNPEDLSIENVLRQSIELISRFPVLVAYGYQAKRHYYHGESLYIHPPQPDLSTAENFLYLIRPDKEYTRSEAEILDLALVLHAEHGGGNNSTFTIHVVTSAATDVYSAVAAAIGSLKGAKHGGANIKVMAMMEDIKAHVKDWSDEQEVRDYLVKILNKEAFDRSGLVYGMGHAVYTISDPRAVLLREKAETLAKEKGFEEEFGLYELIARLTPELFAEIKKSNKVIAPNVDFYSGFVYKMLGIPTELYTPIFAVARIAGWSAHLVEELISGGRIIRPAYKNVIGKREYIPLDQRG
ncbi:Citrate synthase [Spirochaeta thermophila DSM 6578]|uniref:Citrate synthase n=1 Tax=Winmispira thermophila (strain ATCC 700085 / DSM 6578 / Z-1203) TaxID=869211 RepID=G0GER0_WINT7|nr:citrate/2-methylcitrate synthase [Spirochaeta thermophila]AEJ61466.1 Citrate synthase [Spirochaeta thermophila DSM 6578]